MTAKQKNSVGKLNLVLLVALVLQIAVIGTTMLLSKRTTARTGRGLLLTGIDTSKLSEIQVEAANEKVSVGRADADGAWHVTEAAGYPADKSKVDDTLRELAGLEIAEVVSTTNEHHVELGVSDDKFDRRLHLKGQGTDVTLLFGSAGRAGTVHVRKANEPTVYAVRNYSAWKLSAQTDAWLDRTYFQFDKARAVRLALKNKNGQLRLEREGDQWFIAQDGGVPTPASKDAVETLLGKASRVTLNQIVGKAAEHPLPDAEAELVVALSGPATAQPSEPAAAPKGEGEGKPAAAAPLNAAETLTLKIANDPTGKDQDRFWLLQEGAGFVAQTSKWSVSGLLDAKAEDFAAKAEKAEKAPPVDAVVEPKP